MVGTRIPAQGSVLWPFCQLCPVSRAVSTGRCNTWSLYVERRMLPMRKYRQRIHYTEADKNMMWDRWRKGESLESIAQLFDRTHGSVARILRRTGGIRPPKRMRSGRTLSLAEREEISRGVVAGRSLRSIAASLQRAPSTVSREVNRNGGRQHYRANVADEAGFCRLKGTSS